MYCVGDRVEYKTATIKRQNTEIFGQSKTGIIEEVLSTLDNKPCYWIKGEKELILGNQIIRKV